VTSADGNGTKVDAVWTALSDVVDPELGIDIVSLGLVYNVDVIGTRAFVRYTLTSMGCPIGPLLAQEISAVAGSVDGVEEAQAELVFDPPWSPDRMNEDARMALGLF
jgi:metal-sulfur cluster biosynthetic enzyme